MNPSDPVYKRGSRFVVVYRSGGRQRKQATETLEEDDIIDARTGEVSTGPHDDFLTDCGDGTADTALLDLRDDLTPTGCGFKERSPLGEGPHVLLKVPERTAVALGRATFRLSCPRALKRACAGTLRLQLGRASSRGTSYSIRPGRSKRVPVRLGGLAPRVRAHEGGPRVR